MPTKSALLVGATGLVGHYLLELLLKESSYDTIIVLARKPISLSHHKLQQHIIDFNQLNRYSGLIKAHDVFCCLGTTINTAGSQEAFRAVDFTYVVQAAALASNNGAGQFLVVSSVGANPNSTVFYTRVKGELEEALSKLPFRALHIFRPSFLFGERKEFRFAELVGSFLLRPLSFMMMGSWRKYRPVHAQTVARAMLNAAGMNLNGINIFESHRIAEIGSS